MLVNPAKVSLNNKDILTQVCFEQIPYSGKYILAFAIFTFAMTTVPGSDAGRKTVSYSANRSVLKNLPPSQGNQSFPTG